jgi:hypothetical protein
VSNASPAREDGFATGYEQLRRGALEGRTAGGQFGLVVLLREGVAAWIVHAATSRTAPRATTPDRPSRSALIPDNVHAAISHVLVNMVMTARKENCV